MDYNSMLKSQFRSTIIKLLVALEKSIKDSTNFMMEAGQGGRRVGSPSHLSPPNYLDNLQTILKIYGFGLRFKERPAGTLQ